ncbi:hypothetical protein B9Z55_025108 [Caenorhabditis nigoni]|uniref:Uncharacterized protein n=1 Tax=Caenorhabditis nigoni TaxID=1611254 RepID=A0A2G5SXB4_9PELO|nr:hypothetical protein B9Z55_025108 [Caenorhabditis nigoni]
MSNDCKLIKDIRDKISKLVAVVKEHRAETKQVNEPPKPEEIEMEVFYRRPPTKRDGVLFVVAQEHQPNRSTSSIQSVSKTGERSISS